MLNPTLLTPCGTPITAAAPVLWLVPALVFDPLAFADSFALALGVAVAVAVLFPLQKILLGLIPPA
jgi:hypothetical protein